MLQALQLPLTNSVRLDSYLTQYCEGTRDQENIYIDIALFKQVSFEAGIPFIILDLVCYLTGGTNNKQIQQICAKILSLLYERVPPVVVKEEPASALLKGKQKFLQSMKTVMREMIKEKQPRIRKLIPPLNSVPDEVYEDEGYDSDLKAQRYEVETQYLTTVKSELAKMQVLAKFEEAYRKVSIHNSKKAKKLAISNAKLSHDEREKPKILDVYMTESSL